MFALTVYNTFVQKVIIVLIIIGIAFGIYAYRYIRSHESLLSPISNSIHKITEKPLEKYTFASLSKTHFPPSAIKLGKPLNDEESFTSYEFSYTVDGKKVSGLMNLPKTAGIYPVLLLLRGFVPREIYTTGEGTRRTGEYFATQGFITLAPDFLGYGHSDDPSVNGIEERFQTYTTVLTLLESIKNLNTTLIATGSGEIRADTEKIGIWGHSNGGHIALAILGITGKAYPTVLWNPVSKPFPYSILYFTDEYDDNGRALRKVVADFEKDYNAEKYSPTNFYKNIKAPIQLDQAVDDEEVPRRWSDQLESVLKERGVAVSYIAYPGENHNFNNGSWPLVVKQSADFFNMSF